MNKLCRQVSIESPGPTIKDCVFSFEVPMPDVPPHGARIRVACAGACYRLHRTPSLSSVSSVSSISSDKSFDLPLFTSPAHPGVRDTALYPGFEVAGIVESLGSEAHAENPLKVGDRVVIFPYEGVPHGYAEFITVTDLKYLVKIPAHMPLSVAAMLPTGALLAMNTVIHAREYTDQLFKEKGENARAKILVVGTGGLALWALRIASYEFQDIENRVCISVATLRDEGFQLAKENLR
ncbi:Hypothetical predicted protein [Cloeon dipterum]|uniref:Enoyl reductase (ER) domain-containing protein n=1 Tax=Cloeon dipterum TaxID=197152 RepID=A0A8S1E3Q3_9INSE|nr:Hypothetical predicted protein [Cloeon dipterum]